MPPTTTNVLDRLFLIISNPLNGYECRESAAFVAGHVYGVISGLSAMRACDDSQRPSQDHAKASANRGEDISQEGAKLCGQEYGQVSFRGSW